MLNLSEHELDLALAAINKHGYGDFFPEPPELSLLIANWQDIRAGIAQVDLDLYGGYDVTFAFAPKSRLNVRRVALLHPFDLVLYTALVLKLRNGITASRPQPHENRVFSYRADGADDGSLYNEQPGYRDFTEAVTVRVNEIQNRTLGLQI